MSKGKKFFLAVFSAVIISLVCAIGCGYYYLVSIFNNTETIKISKENLGIDNNFDSNISSKYEDIQNIAIFGVDAVDGENGRSDAIVIATIDRINKKIKLSSIMRDSYVDIKGKGKDKINHAYAFGGPELAIRTINESFGLNIKDFVAVNLSTMPKIIDMVGGIDINIDSEEINHLVSCGVKETGIKRLSGEQALAYSRIRYTEGGDYKRTERQREVLNSLFSEILAKPVSNYPSLLDEITPMIKTSLNSSDLLSIGIDIVKIGGRIEQDRFPKDGECEGKIINDVYYLTFNKEKTREHLYKWVFENIK